MLLRWQRCFCGGFLVFSCLTWTVASLTLEKVSRAKGTCDACETDTVTFKEKCGGMFCEEMGAYKVGGREDVCKCVCHSNTLYVISKQRCRSTSDLVGNFTISELSTVLSVSLKELESGKSIKYCPKRTTCRPAFTCSANTVSSSQAVFDELWWSVDPSDVDVINTQSGSVLKLKQMSTKYSGLLVKLHMTCQVDSKTISSFATFAVAGEFQGPFVKPSLQNKKTSSDDNMVTLIVVIVLALLLLLSCVVLVIIFRRWRQAKNRNTTGMSEPPFTFAPETPVFLVGNRNRSSKSQMHNIDIISGSNDNIYNSSLAGEQGKKGGTIKGLYASIDKFLKNPSKKKPNGSLDEGYTTDDNYDYQRFSAFPKGLYDQPASTISSFDEPDFKIPEDFHASVITMDQQYPYVPPVHIDSVTVSDNTSQSSEPHYDSVQGQTEESPYDQIGTVIPSGMNEPLERMACPFEGSGGTLLTSKTKLTVLKPQGKRISPYDECGRMILTNARNVDHTKQENKEIIDPYDQVGEVLINKINGQKSDNFEEALDGYDTVGQIIPNCENHDDFHHEYDEPDISVEQSTDVVTDTKPIKTKPPRPPRPDSFDIITNRNVCDEVKI